jgi:ribosomal protein S18 acetylase RimI-like enzyme
MPSASGGKPRRRHRVELEVLAGNERAIRCYEAYGFRHEGVRREAELYPDGWKDFLQMCILQAEHQAFTSQNVPVPSPNPPGRWLPRGGFEVPSRRL